MVRWPRPHNIKSLRGFLGLTGYYRRFVKNYGKIASPLTDLLKKDAFKWTDAASEAFEQLKTAMMTLPVLALPDFTRPFELETDASGTGVGAVLMQKGRPVAYFNQKLSRRAQRCPVYERELMAIVMAVNKWQHYLGGQKFIIRTDQKALKCLLEQRIIEENQQHWVSKLMEFKFEILYKPGKDNRVADSLSRQEELEMCGLSLWQFDDIEEWEKEVQENPKLNHILQQLITKPGSVEGFSLKRGYLHYKEHLVLPKNSCRIPLLLKEFHDSPIGGHSGYLRTYKRMANVIYWEGMKRDIQHYVSQCDVCQRNKYQALSPAGLLQPLPLPQQTWEDISMDFITGLPRTKRYDTVMVVVDRLTKYAHFLALAHPFTAKDVAEKFVTNIVKLHGFPKSIVSDRDRIFVSQFWKELFKQAGTQLCLSSAYHPKTDGQTEVLNRGLETYLRCFANETPTQWVHWLSWAEYWYNTSYHSAAGMTPFKAVYRRDPPTFVKFSHEPSMIEAVNEQIQSRNAIIETLKDNLAMAQSKMKEQANKHRRDVHFEVGDMVYVKIKPYRMKTLARKLNEKLSPRFYGPFKIIEPIGKVAYKLELPPTTRIHPVFHISQLKKSVSSAAVTPTIPPAFSATWELQVQPEDIYEVRRLTNGQLEVLVKWKALPDFENSWEDTTTLSKQFPNFPLEDKVKLLGEGNDVACGFKQTYKRKVRRTPRTDK